MDGEKVDWNAHYPPRECDDDDAADYYECYGWEPKESIEKIEKHSRTASAPFQCHGGSHDPETYGPHDVQASAESPATVAAVLTTYSELTPFSERRFKTVRFQCEACQEADIKEDEFRHKLDEQWAEQEKEQWEQLEKEKRERAKERAKKRKAEAQNEQEKRLKQMAESDPTLGEKLNGLKLPHLKSLCKANHLMVAGTKPVLIDRLVMCHVHGHGGPCPDCRKSKMQLVFENPEAPMEPTHLECRHFWSNGKQCRFNKKEITVENKASMLPHRLRDDGEGALRSVGIDVQENRV